MADADAQSRAKRVRPSFKGADVKAAIEWLEKSGVSVEPVEISVPAS